MTTARIRDVLSQLAKSASAAWSDAGRLSATKRLPQKGPPFPNNQDLLLAVRLRAEDSSRGHQGRYQLYAMLHSVAGSRKASQPSDLLRVVPIFATIRDFTRHGVLFISHL
jgi:hypothetical protein